MNIRKSIAKSYDRVAREYVTKHGYGEQLSLPALKKFLSLLPDGADVLDVGCGGGQDSKFLAVSGCAVLGIDFSTEMIKLAKKYAPEVDFKVADVMKLSAVKKFDGIWCCRVFHHVSFKEQENFLDKLYALLTKGGILYITAVVSDKKEDYEAFDSGSDGLLKKRLTEKSFKNSLKLSGFKILQFKYWVGKRGMEIFVKR